MLTLLLSLLAVAAAWTTPPARVRVSLVRRPISFGNPFDAIADKLSDQDRGMSVVKLQIACNCKDRGAGALLPSLQALASKANTETDAGLARFLADACLLLLRREAEWVSSAGECAGFFREGKDADAEGAFNRLVVQEAAKFDEEPGAAAGPDAPGATLAVVSLVACVYGDLTEAASGFAGSLAGTRAALNELASAAGSYDGVVAAELLWSPDEPGDVLDPGDVITAWPELISI